MKSLPAMPTQNIKIGKKSLWKTPVGKSIPLTQGTWMFSAPDWVEESWTTTGKSFWHAEKKPTYMVPLWASKMTGRKSRHNCRHGTHPGIPPASPHHVPNWPPYLVPCSWSAWYPPTASQIIHRAMKVLDFCPITPAHRKPPWPGYEQGMRLFTKLLVAHPLVGVCLPPDTLPAEALKLAGYMVGSLFIRGHSAGSYTGMVWESILAEFPNIEGRTVLAAIALPPSS